MYKIDYSFRRQLGSIARFIGEMIHIGKEYVLYFYSFAIICASFIGDALNVDDSEHYE